jgi:hypothetical protein
MTSVKYVLFVLCLFSLAAKISAQTGRHLHAATTTVTRSQEIFAPGTSSQIFLTPLSAPGILVRP